RLFGGQCQRVAIARALLSQAPVLVMDEASSSLDAHSEHALQQALLGLRGQRTLLLIAHRPSTIAQADRVVLLEDGQVRDQGTHSTLLARCDAYARLLAQPTQ
uniref:ATP-binding cassette domain-containing protein n=1 Tax=Metapseudomonas otitidis TaxID=319939 RepID=UPI00197FDF62